MIIENILILVALSGMFLLGVHCGTWLERF